MGKLAALTEAYMIKQMEGATPAQTRLHFMASYAIDAIAPKTRFNVGRERERNSAGAAGNYFVV
jgi:hypothetical protein